MGKNFCKILMAASVIGMSFATPTFASEVNTVQTTNVSDAQISFISMDEIPEGITPLVFDTEEEMMAYAEKLQSKDFDSNISKDKNEDEEMLFGPATTSNSYTTIEKTETINRGLCNIRLYTTIETGANTVSYATASSALTGYTICSEWEPLTEYAHIVNNGKDVESYARGTYKTYLVTSAGGRGVVVSSDTEVLSGYYMIFR